MNCQSTLFRETGHTTNLVTLSRKNLTDLLRMLDNKVGMPSLVREVEDGNRLIVRAEEDDEHYQGRTPGPGYKVKE